MISFSRYDVLLALFNGERDSFPGVQHLRHWKARKLSIQAVMELVLDVGRGRDGRIATDNGSADRRGDLGSVGGCT